MRSLARRSCLTRLLPGLLGLALAASGALAVAPADAAGSAGSGAGGSASPASLASRYYAAQSAANKAQIDAIRADQPANFLQRLATLRQQHRVNPSPADIALRQQLEKVAPGPDDYSCTSTKLNGYLNGLLDQFDRRTLNALFFLGAFDLPTSDALLNGTQGDPNYAVDPTYRNKVVKTFTTEQTFWSTPLTDVQLIGMDSGLLTDVTRLTALYVQLGMKPAAAARNAQKLATLVQSPAVPQGADNPLFTANAFAVPAEESSTGSPMVVMGAGILDAMATIGLGKAAPQFVTSHEMGHQLQFASGIYDDSFSFRAIRRTELQADGFAGYFAAHPKGLRLSPTLLAQGASAAFQVGDCFFGLPGSHGTPNQRRAATDWGIAEVAYASDPTVVLTAVALDKDFTKALKVILLPDADPTPDDFRALVAS